MGVGLLGTHVLERADDLPLCRHRGAFAGFGLEEASDTEVDDLGDQPVVLFGDEHVGGLQVAVDDPALVRVLHRVADAREELEPGREVEAVLLGGAVRASPSRTPWRK